MKAVRQTSTKQDGPEAPKHAFTNKSVHPLVLNLLLIKEFGPEYLGWEPETCWVEISRTWGSTVSEVNRSKIQAIRTCHTTSQPYERWEIFDLVCSGLIGTPPKFDLIQKPTPHRAAFALDVMAQIKEDTKATIRCILFNQNISGLTCIYSQKPAQYKVIFSKAY